MKKLLLAAAVFSAALIQPARASTLLPYLEQIRTEIINQQVILSNAPPVDRRLATALRAARTQIERTTPTNLVNDTKALSSLTATLNRSSLSNVFDPLIRTALSNYVGEAEGALNTFSNALILTFPSGPHTAANNIINQVFDAIDAAVANGNTTFATKGLAALTRKLGVLQGLLTRALNAPPPPVQLKATIVATPEGTVHFQPTPAKAAVASRLGDLIHIIGTQTFLQNRSVTFRVLDITIPNIADGTHVYAVGPNDGNHATVVYVGASSATFTGETYTADSGTLTVTYNSSTKAAAGSFTFSAPGQGNASNTASSNDGVFSVVHP